jgi:hypothetical protein
MCPIYNSLHLEQPVKNRPVKIKTTDQKAKFFSLIKSIGEGKHCKINQNKLSFYCF